MALLTRFRKLFVYIAGIAAGVIFPTKNENEFTLVDSTTTPLIIGGVYQTGAAIDSSRYGFITGVLKADQAGTAQWQFSYDGTDWIGQTPHNYVANDPLNFKVPVTAPFFRFRYVNGGVAQTSFKAYVYGSLFG